MKKDEVISILATSARPREPKNRTRYDEAVKMAIEALRQPEIIRCKDCVKRNRKLGSLDEHYNRYNKSQCCPMIEFRGMPQGHEYDYQYCSWAERRTDEE